MSVKLILAAIAIATAVPAIAGSPVTLTFDDVSGGIPNGYQGYNWDNFYTLDAVSYTDSGYKHDLVSGTNVAYNAYAAPATISSGTAFSLTSGYFAGAWNDGLTIQLVGTLGGSAVFTQSFTVTSTEPNFISLNHSAVDNVVFSSFGGTPHGYNGGGDHFALDNLTINGAVPEPASWALMLAGFGLVGTAIRRRTVSATFA